MSMHSSGRREAAFPAPVRHVRRHGCNVGAFLWQPWGRFCAHSDDAPVTDDMDRESMPKDVDEGVEPCGTTVRDEKMHSDVT